MRNPKILKVLAANVCCRRSFCTNLNLQNAQGNFNEDFNNSRIAVSNPQRLLLGLGSSVMSLVDPYRADMIAIMGETTGISAMKYMKSRMEDDPEGIRILKDKPRINSSTVDLERLKSLPDDTLGRRYYKFLEVNKVTPDSRDMVRFVDDFELAYVIQRYREIHDLVHTLLDMPINMLGEVTVKWVEAFQTRLPLCILGGLFGAIRLAPRQRQNYVKYHLPWAIETGTKSKFLMNVYFEERWEQPMSELLKELNITSLVLPTKKSTT